MDTGEVFILVLLDLSKCFDIVPHHKLLQKLTLYGIDSQRFRNYLTGHTQQVQQRNNTNGRTSQQNLGTYGAALVVVPRVTQRALLYFYDHLRPLIVAELPRNGKSQSSFPINIQVSIDIARDSYVLRIQMPQ